MVIFKYTTGEDDITMHGYKTIKFKCEFCGWEHSYFMYAPTSCIGCQTPFGEELATMTISKQARLRFHYNRETFSTGITKHVPITRNCLL